MGCGKVRHENLFLGMKAISILYGDDEGGGWGVER